MAESLLIVEHGPKIANPVAGLWLKGRKPERPSVNALAPILMPSGAFQGKNGRAREKKVKVGLLESESPKCPKGSGGPPDRQLSQVLTKLPFVPARIQNLHPSTPQHHSSPHSFACSLRRYNQTPCFSHFNMFTPGSSAGFIWSGISTNVKYPLARS